MVVSKKEARIFNIMRIIILLALIIVSVITGFWLYNNQPDKLKEKQQVKQIDFYQWSRWRSCIDNSDSTNTDCQECDRLFNKEGIFEY